MKKLSLDVGSVSDVGKVREVNQDKIFVGKSFYRKSECGMFVVADGMGGMEQGEVSSTIAVSHLSECWNSFVSILLGGNSQTALFFEKKIIEAFFDANDKILSYGQLNQITLGTTVSLLFILKNRFFICHAGDSRIYRLRGQKVEQLTQDHTWAARQIRNKKMTLEQIMVHPNKNKLDSCIGVYKKPEIFTLSGKIKSGDVFLICSDGFYRFISHQEVVGILEKNIPLQQVALETISMVMQREASDNISAILVKSL